jgi:hypothetical protein
LRDLSKYREGEVIMPGTPKIKEKIDLGGRDS